MKLQGCPSRSPSPTEKPLKICSHTSELPSGIHVLFECLNAHDMICVMGCCPLTPPGAKSENQQGILVLKTTYKINSIIKLQ